MAWPSRTVLDRGCNHLFPVWGGPSSYDVRHLKSGAGAIGSPETRSTGNEKDTGPPQESLLGRA